ncbi:MAG: ATP synthase F1 subunit delta [Actinomycetota bacterium]|nr:ATP synthase F1 subunit delta [Actinomycetota bacterium]
MARDDAIRGYAEAIFAVAEADGVLDQVEDELFRFARSLEREQRLREALTDPGLPLERKRAVLQDIAGERAIPQTVALLSFIVEQGRARDLTEIVDRVAALAAERRRAAVAEVRTAVPLDEEHRRRLIEALGGATGKTVELKVVVDPSVIGGVVARVGDQVIDGSIRRRLELARERMTET